MICHLFGRNSALAHYHDRAPYSQTSQLMHLTPRIAIDDLFAIY